jgi:hypothetical protein
MADSSPSLVKVASEILILSDTPASVELSFSSNILRFGSGHAIVGSARIGSGQQKSDPCRTLTYIHQSSLTL